MRLTNNSNLPLSVAVFLASNTYGFKPNPKALSATDFNKSIRQIILRNRINGGELVSEAQDIVNLVKSKNGTAIHDAIEKTWTSPFLRNNALKALGYPDSVVDRIVVNPSINEVEADPTLIPVYMEIRNSLEVDGYTISGQFDFVAEQTLTDFKSTGTWKYAKLDKADKDYRTQGSIYRVLNPEIITKDHMNVVFWFTDWMESRTLSDPKYPKAPILAHKVELMSVEETMGIIRQRIAELEANVDTPEPDLPECTPEQLWQDEPTYKYYKNPNSRSRSTANFTSFFEAQQRFIKDGAVGIVVTVPSKAKACSYCAAATSCSQRLKLIEQGLVDE